MSGFEVVGVVLGALPLLITGLEHYAEGIHTIKNMWDYEAVVNHLVSEFMLSEGIFRHSCQELLVPILPDIEAAKLLEGGSPDWEDPGLDKRLREHLGPDYEIYTRAVRHLKRRIELFTRKLGLDKSTMLVSHRYFWQGHTQHPLTFYQPPWMSNAQVDKSLRDKYFRHTWQRIRGGFDTPAVDRLLAEIQNTISKIAQLTKGSIAVAPKRIALQIRSSSRYWLQTKEHARRLFKSLGSHWSCACPHAHRASLRLDLRQSSNMPEEKGFRFNVLFSYDLDSARLSPNPLPWNWREININIQPLPSKSVR